MQFNDKKDIVLDFIRQFRSLGSENCFSSGMCFWFATILKERFSWTAPKIVYDPIVNHFACEIDNAIYDITGDVTNNKEYKWQYWDSYKRIDQKESQRLYRDCIDKIPSDTVTCCYCPHSYFDSLYNLICSKDNSPHDPDDICERKKEE